MAIKFFMIPCVLNYSVLLTVLNSIVKLFLYYLNSREENIKDL